MSTRIRSVARRIELISLISVNDFAIVRPRVFDSIITTVPVARRGPIEACLHTNAPSYIAPAPPPSSANTISN